MQRHAALVLLLLWSTPLHAALPEGFGDHPEALRVKLVTFGPGPHARERLGHSAAWVEDTRLGASVLYSYGVTSFTRGAELRYLLERPTYWAARLSVETSFFLYRARGRSISVQELALSVAQRRRLFERFERDVQPLTREYPYDPLRDNCATRLRDALDEALDGALRTQLSGPASMSLREHFRRDLREAPVQDLLLLLWLNDVVDAPMSRWQEAALPMELARALEQGTVMNEAGERVPLVSRHHEEYAPPLTARGALPLPVTALLSGVFAFGTAVLLTLQRHRSQRAFRIAFGLYHALLGLTLGTVGTAGFVLMLVSEHPVMRLNENQWMLNPLTLALLPLGLRMALGHPGAERWARRCVGVLVFGSLLAVALKALPSFDQQTREPMSFLLVANLGLGLVHTRRWRAAGSAWSLRRVPPVRS